MSKTINWGIIGLGNIAHKFAADLLLADDANLKGVASRDEEKALQFAKKYHSDRHYTSYEEMAKDAEIDVIYVATPHVFHFEQTMMCLKAGKHVLCEKAFGMNAQEVQMMISEAQKRKLFLMEALWTRFIPITEKLLQLVQQKTIGEIKQIRADFGFMGDQNPDRRIYNKKLGGGSLLDVGIYPVYLSVLLLGSPLSIQALAEMTSTGVDAFCAMLFDYPQGEKAVLESSIEVKTPTEAYIFGDQGSIKLYPSFHHSEKLSIQIHDQKTEIIELKYKGNGYYHEIMEVHSCLHQGSIESKKMSHAMSLNLILTLDAIREKIGLFYE